MAWPACYSDMSTFFFTSRKSGLWRISSLDTKFLDALPRTDAPCFIEREGRRNCGGIGADHAMHSWMRLGATFTVPPRKSPCGVILSCSRCYSNVYSVSSTKWIALASFEQAKQCLLGLRFRTPTYLSVYYNSFRGRPVICLSAFEHYVASSMTHDPCCERGT